MESLLSAGGAKITELCLRGASQWPTFRSEKRKCSMLTRCPPSRNSKLDRDTQWFSVHGSGRPKTASECSNAPTGSNTDQKGGRRFKHYTAHTRRMTLLSRLSTYMAYGRNLTQPGVSSCVKRGGRSCAYCLPTTHARRTYDSWHSRPGRMEALP